MIRSRFLHHMICTGPIAMTIEQRADDPPAQHSRKRFLISFRVKSCDNFTAVGKAANVQAFFVCRAAAKAGIVWRVGFLNAFFVHNIFGRNPTVREGANIPRSAPSLTVGFLPSTVLLV